MSPRPGAVAEARALEHLLARGHVLLARNYRVKGGELDLVTEHRGVIVFTEVRARRTNRYGSAAESVTPTKAGRLRRAALAYLLRERGRDDLPCRFDVVTVSGNEAGGTLAHLENVELP